MIYIERTITIEDNSAYIEEPVILYKGDGNIEVKFTINNNPFKYKAGIDQTYGQLIIKRPTADPIFSDVAKLSSNKETSIVHLVITGEMIDELVETGNYDFQIRLLNADMSSRATLPPVSAGILIKEPICEESVNTAPVNYSRAAINREIVDTFDEEGNYNKTDWSNGDIITDKKLNKIEDALYTINDDIPTVPTDVSAFNNDAGYITDISHLATKDELPTNVSELNNDAGYVSEDYVNSVTGNARNEAMNYALGLSNNKADKDHSHDEYLTEHQSLEGYATEEYVNETLDKYVTKNNMSEELNNYVTTDKIEYYATIDYVDESIANIEVSGGGDVNLKNYVTKENPEMIGTFSLNRDPNFHIGDFSVAMGENTKAEGYASHAEGKGTSADGEASHAEGEETSAYGYASHAEGKWTGADGEASHAEGEGTKAHGNYSHAEGMGTVAKGKCQHVQGRYNIEDEENREEYDWEDDHYRYAHIVGNGRNDWERSNAYTLDWKGNAWFAGRAYVGEEYNGERKQLATEEYVDDRIRQIEFGGVDLSNYATKEELNNKADSKHEHDQYLTEHQSLKGYATEEYVNNVIGDIESLLGGI